MKTFKIFTGKSEDDKRENTIAIDVNELGVVNNDDPDEPFTTKPQDWFLGSMIVKEVGEIEITGDTHLLFPSFGVDADIEFGV